MSGKSTTLEGTTGTCVYLVHLDQPYVDPNGRSVQHYLGYSERLARRMAHHRSGTGAAFLRAVALANIPFRVVRIWHPGTRTMERRLKNYKHSSRLCPVCCPEKWEHHGHDHAQSQEAQYPGSTRGADGPTEATPF